MVAAGQVCLKIPLVLLLALKKKGYLCEAGKTHKNGIFCILALSDRSKRTECLLPGSHLSDLQTMHLQEMISICKLPVSHLLRWLPRKHALLVTRCFHHGIVSLGLE